MAVTSSVVSRASALHAKAKNWHVKDSFRQRPLQGRQHWSQGTSVGIPNVIYWHFCICLMLEVRFMHP